MLTIISGPPGKNITEEIIIMETKTKNAYDHIRNSIEKVKK